jgi:transposase
MAYNFLACDRDQAFLLPPDLREWLSADHLAWFVLDVVDQLDLGPFLAAYRADGHGRAAYEPRMLLGVLLYAYCTGVRSSRQIERRCHEDIGFRVLSGNSRPDHVTIARFRVRHEQALAGLLIQSLRLCAAAGMVRLGLVALDGTKVAANAAERANRTHAHLEAQVAELLQQAAEADRAEDQQHGAARGDELPRALAGRAERLARLQRAKALLEAEAAARQQRYQQRVADLAAAARARGQRPRAHIRPRRRDEAPNPKATVNTTDPDSRLVHGNGRTLQGYNAQAAATPEQIVVAAELTQQANDLQQLAPDADRHPHHPDRRRHQRPGPAAGGRLRLLVDRECVGDPRRAGAVDPAGPPWPPRQAPQGRSALGVPKRQPAGCDAGQAGQPAGQGLLRPAQPDHRAGLRSGQDGAGRLAVHAPGPDRL